MIRRGVAVTLLTLAVSTAAAQAQDRDYSEAERLFREGEELYASEAWARAAERFQAAMEQMEGHPNRALVWFNIGRTLERLPERLEDALLAYRHLIDETNSGQADRPAIQQARSRALERIAEIEARLQHVTRDEFAPSDAQRATSGSEPSVDHGLLAGTITSLSLGGLGLGSMAVFGGLTIAEHDALAAGCGESGGCRTEELSTMRTFAAVSDVSLAVGLAASGVGLVLLIVTLTGEDSQGNPGVAVAPHATDSEAGMLLRGQF